MCRRKFDAHRMLSGSVFVDYMLKVGNLVLKTELKTLIGHRKELKSFFTFVIIKLPAILSHRRNTTASLETCPFYAC